MRATIIKKTKNKYNIFLGVPTDVVIFYTYSRDMSSATLKHSGKKGRKTLKQAVIKDSFLRSVKLGAKNLPFAIDMKFWIFVPVYNFDKFLNQCLRSIHTQTYKNYCLVIIDDCSSDSSPSIISKWSTMFDSLKVIKNKDNMGPGHTKWQAIQYVRKKANKNDVFLIMDGDDCFLNKYALETIVTNYLTHKCWMTYGSDNGKFAKRTFKQDKQRIDEVRKKARFNFQHPRTCLCFLLTYFTEADFQDEDKQWLRRVTDRMFVYKLLELSGERRVCNIKDRIYLYREHADNVRNKVSKDYKEEIIKFISKTESAKQIEEKIHIVMCCYKRHENIKDIIVAVDKQSVAKRVVFHVINTNPEPAKWLFLKSLIEEPSLVKHIEIRLCNTKKNLFGYARFLYVKQLLKTDVVPYVLFIDDDQKLAPTWVADMYATRQPLAYNCWFGRLFNMHKETAKIGYWDGVLSTNEEFRKPEYDAVTQFHYGGTCGCIIDTNVFRFEILFRCPDEYRNIEDLWLSYVVKQIVGGRINVTRIPIVMHQFENEGKTALWRTIGERKSVFLRELIDCGFIRAAGYNKRCLDGKLEKENDSEKSIRAFEYYELGR